MVRTARNGATDCPTGSRKSTFFRDVEGATHKGLRERRYWNGCAGRRVGNQIVSGASSIQRFGEKKKEEDKEYCVTCRENITRLLVPVGRKGGEALCKFNANTRKLASFVGKGDKNPPPAKEGPYSYAAERKGEVKRENDHSVEEVRILLGHTQGVRKG